MEHIASTLQKKPTDWSPQQKNQACQQISSSGSVQNLFLHPFGAPAKTLWEKKNYGGWSKTDTRPQKQCKKEKKEWILKLTQYSEWYHLHVLSGQRVCGCYRGRRERARGGERSKTIYFDKTEERSGSGEQGRV